MPKVNGKKYPYTKKGKAEAKKAMKKQVGKKTMEQLKKMKNSLVKNMAMARRKGTSNPKSKSTVSKKEFDKLKTYKKKR